MLKKPRRNDRFVRDRVMFELESRDETKAGDIAVSVKAGIATLFGLVSSPEEREAAETVTKRVYGVRALVDEIRVVDPSLKTDFDIVQEAVSRLDEALGDANRKFKLIVRNGWVTIEGSIAVEAQPQKVLAESVIQKLPGVNGVIDKIEVTPHVSLEEAKLKIEEALRGGAEFYAHRVRVEVEGSTIRLYGTARSSEERSEAEWAAWQIRGISKIENNIEVTPS
jgi:osmotically-inducible protein OsmY